MTKLSDTQDSALRLQLAIDIEAKIESRFKEKESEYKTKISLLDEENRLLKQNLANHADNPAASQAANEKELAYQRTIEELNGQISSLKAKLKQHHAKIEPLKEENARFKKLNPLTTKKKLDETKKKLKDLREATADLNRRNKRFLDIISSQKRKIELILADQEAAKDTVLCRSDCGDFAIMSTLFESDQRPFAVEGLNYRAINLKTGASYVPAIIDGQVVFEETDGIPQDLIEYIQSCVQFETADD